MHSHLKKQLRKQGMVIAPHKSMPADFVTREKQAMSVAMSVMRGSSWGGSVRSLEASMVYNDPSLLRPTSQGLSQGLSLARTRVSTAASRPNASSSSVPPPVAEVPSPRKVKPRRPPPPPAKPPPAPAFPPATSRKLRTPSHAVAMTLAFMSSSSIKLKPGELPPGDEKLPYAAQSTSKRRMTASKQVRPPRARAKQ
jgi:hypothetical protein